MEIPNLIYGTAWKGAKTADLVTLAIKLGFRGIDTACQPKHYHEAGVGDALVKLKEEGIKREDLFIQTKFTPLNGQDPLSIPYNPNTSLDKQVFQSFEVSKTNLKVDYIDALILHAPLENRDQLLIVWQAMETIYDQQEAKQLGISNCYDVEVLKMLYEKARVKPTILQNRFYRQTHYDMVLRKWCDEKSIIYQSFWTLTANPDILARLKTMAQALNKTEAQIFFRFLTQIGIVPLTGTCSLEHMKEDLEIFNFELSELLIQEIQELLRP